MLQMEGRAIFQVSDGVDRLSPNRVMRDRGSGLIGDLVLGVTGALLGGFLASEQLKGPNAVDGINVTSMPEALIGATISVALLRMVSGRRRQSEGTVEIYLK